MYSWGQLGPCLLFDFSVRVPSQSPVPEPLSFSSTDYPVAPSLALPASVATALASSSSLGALAPADQSAHLPVTLPGGVDHGALFRVLRFGSMAPADLLQLFDGARESVPGSTAELSLGGFGGTGIEGGRLDEVPQLEGRGGIADWLLAWGEIDLTQDLDGLDGRVETPRPAPMSVLDGAADETTALERIRSLMNEAVTAMNSVRPREAAELFAAAREIWLAGEIETELWRGLRRAARQRIDVTSLLELAKNPFERLHLRQFLRTFPEWRVQPLLRRLAREKSRRIRHQLLTLLTVHGWDTRREAADRLVSDATDRSLGMPWYVTRNLIYLLRSLQEGPVVKAHSGNAYELAGVLSFADLSQPAPVLFEAIGYLGRSADRRSGRRLLDLLEELEPKRYSDSDAASETRALYDFVSDRLLRRPNEAVRLRVLDSLTRSKGRDSFSAVECLSSESLEGYPRLLKRLIEIAEAGGRRQWFGLRRADLKSCESSLIALSSTDTPAVRQLLDRLAGSASNRETRQLARSISARFAHNREFQQRAGALLVGLEGQQLERSA